MTINELYVANTAWEPWSCVEVVSEKFNWRTLFKGSFIDMPEKIKTLNVRTFSNDLIYTR